MKQTAVEKLLEFFIKQEKEGCSHWCIHDLIAWLYISKEIEKGQIIEAYNEGQNTPYEYSESNDVNWYDGNNYYKETFES
jgi:hypothetical protein